MPLFELRNLTKMKDTTETVLQHNSTETAQQNFIKLCSYEGHNVKFIWICTGNAELIFLRSNLYPFWTLTKIILCNTDEISFLSDCPSLMLEIAIRCIQHSQAMLERGVCELAHSFFHQWIGGSGHRLGSGCGYGIFISLLQRFRTGYL